MNSLDKFTPYALAALRLVTAYLFFTHGTDKVFGVPHLFGAQPLDSLFGIAGIMEVIGGALMILGLFTRPVAFILSGQMAVAYFHVHATADTFLFPILNQGEPPVLYTFIFLLIVFAGPGAWALDNRKK
ncbi:DoxX family protein [Otariodibacter oris]|uniref:Putative oxidoreductase n=1 Tax=Otariodibacter oris TaxID=1032623 RepID=A0A420XI49_9PAST|nr:DoxX family protein [Otariodibacter oris]QGM80999.1 LuxR family transcriptional regulator [Otariodibacter oris]RKR76821.1 putative oxidoreductase [Otariodibacter oris]